MTLTLSHLPDDPEMLKAIVLSMAENIAGKVLETSEMESRIVSLTAQNAHLDDVVRRSEERIAALTSMVKMLERSQYGTRSERLRMDALTDEQCAFVFDEIDTGFGAIQMELETTSPDRDKPRRAPRPRKSFAAHLERVDIVIEPEVPEGCEGLEKVLIGEDVSERLDVTPAKFRVIVTHRPKYAYRGKDGVFQAPAPAHIIEGGIATEALLAQIAVSKYADGLPLYRQEAIYLRDQVELDRSLMAQWMGQIGFELQPLADHILDRIREGSRVFADETTLPTLVPGSGKAKKAYLWAYARDDSSFGEAGPPMVAYRFEDNRSTQCVARHMAGFTGILQVDGYGAYTSLVKSAGNNNAITLAGCWAHVRRKFYELHVNGSSELARASLPVMAKLWQVEENVRGKDAATRAAGRQKHSAAVVKSLFDVWEKELPRVSGKSKIAEAIRYAISRRTSLEQFLYDGRIEIDSNIVERAIRPQTITRKNSLFAGSYGGGTTWATIATLLQTAKMNDIDPLAWLTQTLTRIANQWPNSKIDELMPWNYRPEN